MKRNSFNFLSAAVLAFSSLTGLLASTNASATLASGAATLTFNNSSVVASNSSDFYVERHWGAEDNALTINGDTTGGTALSKTSSTSLLFPVNSNSTTIVTSSDGYGRTEQATTMDTDSIGSGQIGLSGALRLLSDSSDGYLSPYDLSLVKDSGTGDWVFRAYDNAFGYTSLFQLGNVSEVVSNGQLLLSGDLLWSSNPNTGFQWANMIGADTTAVIGSFNLAPSAVPVPAAGWLFGSGLVGLIANGRRKLKG